MSDTEQRKELNRLVVAALALRKVVDDEEAALAARRNQVGRAVRELLRRGRIEAGLSLRQAALKMESLVVSWACQRIK